MRWRGKSEVAAVALVACSALSLALGGCSSGSDSGDSDIVQVTGTSTQTEDITWTNEASDPRVSGEATNDPDCEYVEDGDRTIGVCMVTSKMSNDGGTWEGGCTGTTTWTATEPEHMHDFDCTWVGGGGYLGLRYRFNIAGGDGPWEFTGQIEPFASASAS